LDVLKNHILPQAKILEVASGTGQHADYFTSQMPEWIWQPSDINNDYIASINCYRSESKRENFLEPIKLSTVCSAWDVGHFDAALCCNMIHIAPWESCVGLFKHLSKHILPKGIAAIYGPFFQKNVPTAPSNSIFNDHLLAINSAWGLRDLSSVEDLANENGFMQKKIYDMPANNLCVIFEKNTGEN
jgi:hypothetical protein